MASGIPPIIERCIFCNKSPTNKEHVYPRWSHKYIQKYPGKYLSTRGQESRTSSELSVVRGKGDIHDWQVKCVDETCNNGWMRELENRAKPVLTPLIQGERTQLAPNDRRAIAGWAVLKAVIGEYETGMISWTEKDRERMRRIQLPPARNCVVWAATVDRGNWKHQWLCYAFPGHIGNPKRRTNSAARDFESAATTQIIGNLLLHVLHGPLLGVIRRRGYFPRNDSRFPVIWPVTEGPTTWIANPISHQQGLDIATGLYAAISGNSKGARAAW